MKAIGYVRVSTEEQSADDKFGIDVQKTAIKEYADTHGYEVVHWCIDTISGVKDNRPEMDKLLYHGDELPAHDAVIAFKNDRIARDTKLYFYYLYELEKQGVKLVSTNEDFIEGNEFANIYRSLMMFVAEQERRNIDLRTSNGRKLKAKQGGYAGGNKPYGYKVQDGCLVVDKEEEIVVRYVFELRNDGETLADICDILYDRGYRTRKGKRFQPSTVKSILNNEKVYRGYYRYGDNDWVLGQQQAILV